MSEEKLPEVASSQEDVQNQTNPKKKLKLGRAIVRWVLWTIFVLSIPVLVVQFPPVQTWLVQRISAVLSNRLETTVAINSVNIRFFNKLVLEGVYIEDLNRDTMIYVASIAAGVEQLPLFGKPLVVGHLDLDDGVFNLRTDSTGANVSTMLAKLSNPKPKDTTSRRNTFVLETHSLKLNNFTFTMILQNAPTLEDKPYGIIFQRAYLDSLYLSADRIDLHQDSVFFRLKSMNFHERSGFRLQHMQVDTGYVCFGKDVLLKGVQLKDDFSDLRLRHFRMLYNGGTEFKDFVHKVNMEADVTESQVSFATIGYFAPTLRKVPISNATVHGLVSGTVSNMKGTALHITALESTVIDGRFSIQGLPDIENSIIFADLTKMATSRSDVVHVVDGLTTDSWISLNNTLSAMNRLNFSGTFTGLINDFVANGKLVSDVGSLKMDVLFNTEAQKPTILKGRLTAQDLEVGKLLKSDVFGAASFNLMVDGKLNPNNINDIFSEGQISSLVMNGYNYENIGISGRLFRSEFNGNVSIGDPNVDFDFVGKLNLKGTPDDPTPLYDFVANIRHIDLVKLNINKRDSVSIFSGRINANFRGKSILDYVGELSIGEARYQDALGAIDLGNIVLSSSNLTNRNVLSLRSKFIEVDYLGKYELIGLIKDVEKLMYTYFPAFNPDKAREAMLNAFSTDAYELHIRTKTSGEVARILHPGLYVAENSKLDVYLDTQGKLRVDLLSDKIQLNKNIISKLNLQGRNTKESLSLNLASSQLETGGFAFQNFTVHSNVRENLLNTTISFNDTASKQNKAKLDMQTKFIRPSQEDALKLKIDMDRSDLTLQGREWSLAAFNVMIDSSRIALDGFDFYRGDQHLRAEGVISHMPDDTLKLALDNFRLSGFNSMAQRRGYELEGSVTGKIDLLSLYDKTQLSLNLTIDNVLVNKDTLGNIIAICTWDKDKDRFDMISRIYDQKGIITNINGYLELESKKVHLDAKIDRLKLSYLNPLLKGILSEIKGTTEGNLYLRGNLQQPHLSGDLQVKHMDMKVDYLQTKYTVDARVRVDSTSFTIQKGKIFDPSGSSGELRVNVNHSNFSHITFDAFASLTNMLCLNTKDKDNPMFYGTAYATGGISISGTPSEFNFDITAKAEKNSILYIPLSNTAEAKDIEFLKFKPKATGDDSMRPASTTQPKAKISLYMDLSVTPESEIQILVDEKVGDIIRARGQGNLKIKVNPSINLFDIVGDYMIEKGDYNFTVPNFSIISRKFDIDRGSSISFKGDVMNALLDVKASYKERVSLAAFSTTTDVTARRNTVLCQIFITGRMLKPDLKFNLEFLDLDPERKARIMTSINTEEKMTRQFLALLVAKTFLPDQDAATQSENIGSTALVGNASELLSAQIGSLVSMFNLPIPLDISVDYAADAKSRGPEYDFDISTQLFDRILINGTATNSSRADRNFVGDFEVEYLLTKDGRLRTKAFTKAHDYFFGDMETNRQGVGISYQGEFDKFKDLLFPKKKKYPWSKDKDKAPIAPPRKEDEEE